MRHLYTQEIRGPLLLWVEGVVSGYAITYTRYAMKHRDSGAAYFVVEESTFRILYRFYYNMNQFTGHKF